MREALSKKDPPKVDSLKGNNTIHLPSGHCPGHRGGRRDEHLVTLCLKVVMQFTSTAKEGVTVHRAPPLNDTP